jgi:hypothetical protein
MEPYIAFIAMEPQLIIAKGVHGTNTRISALEEFVRDNPTWKFVNKRCPWIRRPNNQVSNN